jgi:hypothetical protein
METADKTIASGDNDGAVSMSPPAPCSTLWCLRFVTHDAKSTAWLTVDGPMPLERHLTAFDMGYCVDMLCVSNAEHQGRSEATHPERSCSQIGCQHGHD